MPDGWIDELATVELPPLIDDATERHLSGSVEPYQPGSLRRCRKLARLVLKQRDIPGPKVSLLVDAFDELLAQTERRVASDRDLLGRLRDRAALLGTCRTRV